MWQKQKSTAAEPEEDKEEMEEATASIAAANEM